MANIVANDQFEHESNFDIMHNLREGVLMITISQGHSSKDNGSDHEILHTHPFLGLPFQVVVVIVIVAV